MLKHKTSVLFVNNAGKEKKSIQVPTTILLSWKKYLFALVAIIVLLCGVVCFIVFRQTSDYYSGTFNARLQRAIQIKKEVNLEKVKASFKSIDQSMRQINKMLAERGLPQQELKNAGGPDDFDITEVNEIAAFYENEITKMESTISNAPIGVPHFGETTSGFGYRYNPFGSGAVEGHKGLDFRGDIGDPVRATAEGIVSFAGVKGGYGNCVIVKHKNGFETLYGHLSKILVKQNQKIESGYQIGELGSTGRSTGPHLHYEVIINGVKTDPAKFTKL